MMSQPFEGWRLNLLPISVPSDGGVISPGRFNGIRLRPLSVHSRRLLSWSGSHLSSGRQIFWVVEINLFVKDLVDVGSALSLMAENN